MIMPVKLRPGTIDDAKECGRILYEAFKSIADQHHFPPDFPSVEVATDVTTMLLSHPGFYAVVAELDDQIVGSNFLDERSVIAGIGPVSVDPPVMNRTLGRQLMQAVMDRATERRFPGVRLVQIAWHYRSLALYTKLGFDTRETLSAMQGTPLALRIPGAISSTPSNRVWPRWSSVRGESPDTRPVSGGSTTPWPRPMMT